MIYHIQVSVENINWESVAELLSNFEAKTQKKVGNFL